MKPILLIHGYSAESRADSFDDITAEDVTDIYGTLPADLRETYGDANVFELNVSRYISLNDGITLDDLATAMQRALQQDEFAHLLNSRFDVIIHSTGALLVRNWLRRFSKKPSPVNHIIYLAGANFGSGWATIGKGQLAKWARLVFPGGGERGLQVLRALELGATQTLDLHRFFLTPENDIYARYKVREFCIVGSQVKRIWLPVPIRFVHEDGSDGVVRVASCNVNMNYIRMVPVSRARNMSWEAVRQYAGKVLSGDHQDRRFTEYYRVAEQFLIDEAERPGVPFAIPFECTHSGDDKGIVRGADVRQEILELLDIAIQVSTPAQYEKAHAEYARRTADNYQRATQLPHRTIRGLFNEPRRQYDPHAQVIFRLRDQYGNPIENYDVFFDSQQGADASINELFEHTYENTGTPGIITYYLRLNRFDSDTLEWVDRLGQIDTVHLEVAPVEPGSSDITYLPLHMTISGDRLRRFIQPNRTTIIDIELLRLPSPAVFTAFPAET